MSSQPNYPAGYYAYPPYPQHNQAFSFSQFPQEQSSSTQTQTQPSSSVPAPSRSSRRNAAPLKGVFTKDLKNLMYGFGDDYHCANDTVGVMEEILVEYIGNLCQNAVAPSKKPRLQIEDLRRVLSRPRDAKKLARMEELLFMQEDIKRARAQLQDPVSGS